jgi:hypothetical protein
MSATQSTYSLKAQGRFRKIALGRETGAMSDAQ